MKRLLVLVLVLGCKEDPKPPATPTTTTTPSTATTPATPNTPSAPTTSSAVPTPQPELPTPTERADTDDKPAHDPRTGETAIRKTPDDAETPTKTQKIEAAACKAPDLKQRYEQLPAADAERLRVTCAKYGVTLREPSR